MYWAHTLAHVNLKFRCRKNWCKIIQYDACFEPEPSYPDQNQENCAICISCQNFAHEKYVLVNLETSAAVSLKTNKKTKRQKHEIKIDITGAVFSLNRKLPCLFLHLKKIVHILAAAGTAIFDHKNCLNSRVSSQFPYQVSLISLCCYTLL